MSNAVNDAPTPRRGFGALAPVVIFAVLAAVFAFALKTGDPHKLRSALIGKPAPMVEFQPMEGLLDNGAPVKGFTYADLGHGKVSVVNFWASWCIPCVQEHPMLVELKKRANVDVYGVDYKDDASAGRRFLGRYGNPFTAVGADLSGRGAIEWGVYGTPETFVIDGQGRIAYKHVGPISPGSLESEVLPAIERARKAG